MSLFSYIPSILGALPAVWFAGRAVMHSCMPISDKQLKLPSQQVIDLPGMKGVFDRTPGLRRDIELIQGSGHTTFKSFGTNSPFSRSGAYILVHQAMMQHEPVGTRFFIRKEISLIQKEHHVKDSVLKAIATLAASLLFDGTLVRVPAIGVAYAMVELAYSHHMEDESTKYALHTATTEELQGALCILEAIKRVHKATSDFGGVWQIKERLREMQARDKPINEDVCSKLVAAFKASGRKARSA